MMAGYEIDPMASGSPSTLLLLLLFLLLLLLLLFLLLLLLYSFYEAGLGKYIWKCQIKLFKYIHFVEASITWELILPRDALYHSPVEYSDSQRYHVLPHNHTEV